MTDEKTAIRKSRRNGPAPDPRKVVLKLMRSKRGFPTRRFAQAADREGLSPRDRGLARELLSGVIRQQRSLDALFDPLIRRDSIDPFVRWTLRLAIYQLFYMDRIPVHAAIDATLNAGRTMLRHALGFANAVLRNVDRAVEGDYLAYMRKCFDECSDDPIERLAVEYSFPSDLVDDWINEVGEAQAIARMQAFNQAPPMSLRVNSLRSSQKEILAAFAEAEIEAEACGENSIVLISKRVNPASMPGFTEGWWSVQDLSSQDTIALSDPKAGERILDLCAAPGGKSFAAFEMSEAKAEVVACDVSEKRLQQIEPEAARLGHQLTCHTIQEDGGGVPDGEWDLILLDVPCTNTGVLGKRAEARWRFTDDYIDSVLAQQKAIIQTAKKFCSKKTRVLYSTCSLEPEENSEIAEYAAKELGLTLSKELKFEPDNRRSGGYAALLIP